MGLKDKKWFKSVVKFAPTIAAALGGPLAGAGISAITSALGLPKDAPDAEIEAAFEQATPADFLALKAQEQEFIKTMEELGLKRDELEFDDIKDARAMKVSTKDPVPAVLTGVALTFFFGLSAAVLTSLDIVQQNESFIMFLFGAASGWVTQGMNFFLGSSRGSQRKTDAMIDSANGGVK
jgi:hypothetical protein